MARAGTQVDAVALAPQLHQVGRVGSSGDGVAMISGLADARLDELLHFAGGRSGFVHTLDRRAQPPGS